MLPMERCQTLFDNKDLFFFIQRKTQWLFCKKKKNALFSVTFILDKGTPKYEESQGLNWDFTGGESLTKVNQG